MKVLAIRPSLTRRGLTQVSLNPEPTSLLVAATALRDAGHEPRVIDLRVTPRLSRELRGFEPDAALVFLSLLSQGRTAALLDDLRRRFPALRILLVPDGEYGMEHIKERPEEWRFAQADAFTSLSYWNDVRDLVPRVIERWSANAPLDDVDGLWLNQGQGRLPDWRPTAPRADRVGDFGVPDRSFLGATRGRYNFGGFGDTAFVATSFGCRFRCRYCTMSKYGGTIFERDLDDIVSELASLTERNVFLFDYESLQAPEHMARLAQRIEAAGIQKRFRFMTRADSVVAQRGLLERWKAIGLEWVFVGLDGHDDERLVELQKGASLDVNQGAMDLLRELEIPALTGFVVSPDATREDFRAVQRAARRLGPAALGFTVETPLVGTRFFDEEGERVTTRDLSLYDLQHAVLPTRLPLGSFYRRLVGLHLFAGRYNLAFMLRHFAWRDLLRTAWMGLPRLVSLFFAARQHKDGLDQGSRGPTHAEGDAALTAARARGSIPARELQAR